MIETVLWLAGGAVVAFAVLVCFTAWLRFLDDDSNMRHNLKCRCVARGHDA